MGSAMCTAVVLAVLILTVFAPVSYSSVLPQIKSANIVEAESETPRTVPVLRKHYLEVSPGVFMAVKGQRERRQVRHARLLKGYSGDRKAIYGREGFPTFRHVEMDGALPLEYWTYLQKEVTYIFKGDQLVGKRPF